MTRKCDFCEREAVYDAKLLGGPWAYVCNKHFVTKANGTKGTFTELEKLIDRASRSN